MNRHKQLQLYIKVIELVAYQASVHRFSINFAEHHTHYIIRNNEDYMLFGKDLENILISKFGELVVSMGDYLNIHHVKRAMDAFLYNNARDGIATNVYKLIASRYDEYKDFVELDPTTLADKLIKEHKHNSIRGGFI